MQKDRAALGKRNKSVGSTAERFYRDQFKNLGYDKCVTSRLGSKLHDNAGVDLIFIPYNVQVKVGIQKGLNPRKELENMVEKMEQVFPEHSPEFKYPKLVIHKKLMDRGKKRTEFDELVTMTFEDFKKMAVVVKEYNDSMKSSDGNTKG